LNIDLRCFYGKYFQWAFQTYFASNHCWNDLKLKPYKKNKKFTGWSRLRNLQESKNSDSFLLEPLMTSSFPAGNNFCCKKPQSTERLGLFCFVYRFYELKLWNGIQSNGLGWHFEKSPITSQKKNFARIK
jgi:hypothetical protein